MDIKISEEIKKATPRYKALILEAGVVNTPTPALLRKEIADIEQEISERLSIEQINKQPAIASTRNAYKACGKDPNRYRPASEQLIRRIVRGLGLYEIDAVVDLINLLSIKSGYAIGCFDRDKIAGDTIIFGIGKEDEPYEGIGRGKLNIAGMPVWRDSIGGFGTPTSDNERTKIELTTKNILVTINIFEEDMTVDQTLSVASRLLTQYAAAENIRSRIVNAS